MTSLTPAGSAAAARTETRRPGFSPIAPVILGDFPDGHARAARVCLRASAGASVRVPLPAFMLEVCGADAEGALLLTVCPLPDPDVGADEGGPRLSVPLDGGRTVALTRALGEGVPR
jgi:hypothetical protein